MIYSVTYACLYHCLTLTYLFQTSDDTLESKMACKAHTCVSEAVLTTMTGYLDWVTMNHIFMKDGLLLRMLCLLLNNRSLQLPAVDCLLIIVSKRVSIFVKYTCFSNSKF